MSKELSLGQKVDISKIYYNFCGLGDVLFSMPALNVAGKVESLVLHPDLSPLKELLEKQPFIEKVGISEECNDEHFKMSHLHLQSNFNCSIVTLTYFASLGFQISKFSHNVRHIKLGGVGTLDIDFHKRDNHSKWPKHKFYAPFETSFIDVPDDGIETKEIGVCWSSRYNDGYGKDYSNVGGIHNPRIFPWHLLEEYKDRCIFLCSESDYKKFVKLYGFEMEFGGQPKRFYHFAKVIKNLKLVVGRPCGPNSLAYVMGVPLLLDISRSIPNIVPLWYNQVSWMSHELIDYFLTNDFPFEYKNYFDIDSTPCYNEEETLKRFYG